MDAQWLPLVGAGIGAASALLGGAIVSRANAAYAQRHWLRDKRAVLAEEFYAALTQAMQATSPNKPDHDNSQNLDIHDRLSDAAAKLALYATPFVYVQANNTAQDYLKWAWKQDMRVQDPTSEADPDEYRDTFLHVARGLRRSLRDELLIDRRPWRQRFMLKWNQRRAQTKVDRLSGSGPSPKKPR